MQIKDLPASSVLNADDVLAKETNGIATEKITGADLAAAVKLLASLLGVSDVVNNLISASTTSPLAAAQGKVLNEHIDIVQNGLTTIEINGNSTSAGAAVGEYVIVRNSTISGIADGLYKATQAIPANTAITSAYLTVVPNGGLNMLNDNIDSLLKIKKYTNTATTSGSGTISGSISDITGANITSGFIVAVYLSRGNFSVYRNVQWGMYGSTGYSLSFTDSGNPITSASVTYDVFVIEG